MHIPTGKSCRGIALQAAVLFFLVSVSFARTPPEWKSLIKDDGTYRYYVGRSTDLDEAKAFNEAYSNAIEQAVRENFGIRTGISSQSYEDSSSSEYTRRMNSESPDVIVRDFEQIDSYKKDKTLHVLFRYSKAAIETEKARMKTDKKRKNTGFTTASGSVRQKGGIEVITEPEDVQVFIDDYPWGFTNTRIDNKFDPGRHTLRLEHPYYHTVYEQLIVIPNETVKISKAMTRAEGTLLVTSYPVDGAEVFIGDRPAGQTPLTFRIPAGEPAEIRIEHIEAEPATTSVQVSKAETRTVDMKLVLKPSTLSISSIPEGAEVRINNERAGKTPIHRHPVPARKYLQVNITKEGYKPYREQNIMLNGGENKTLSPVELENIPENTGSTPSVRSPESVSVEWTRMPLELSAGIIYHSKPFTNIKADMGGLNISAEMRIWKFLGVQAAGTFLTKSVTTDNALGDEKLYGKDLSLSLPVHITEYICIAPEAGRFRGKRSVVITRTGWDVSERIRSDFYGGYIELSTSTHEKFYFSLTGGARKYQDYARHDETVYNGKTSYNITLRGGFRL